MRLRLIPHALLLLACAEAEPAASSAHGATAGAETPRASADPHGRDVLSQLSAIDAPTLPPWEAEVRSILVARYDEDGSGMLDTDAEVDAIVCEVWRALDAGYRERSDQGSLRTAYGFAPDTVYVEVLGISRSQREHLRVDLLDCGVR